MSRRKLDRTPAFLIPAIGFQARKAAQLCAWFTARGGDCNKRAARSGCIEKLKLIKLVYLTEREHVLAYEESMLLDELYSLPHGPICSGTLNGINGQVQQDLWGQYLVRNGNIISAVRNFSRDELDELSDDDLDIAQRIHAQFKDMSGSEIRNYTHDNCPEYTDLTDGRIAITYDSILSKSGFKPIVSVDSDVSDFRNFEVVLHYTR